MIQTNQYFWGNLIVQWTGAIVILLLLWLFLFKTNPGASYRENFLSVHIRALGLVALVIALVYLAFFVDRTRLTSDADTKRVTLANEVAYLQNTIPSINEEFSKSLSLLGELQAIYGGEHDKALLIPSISQAESRTRALYEKTDGAKARILSARLSSPSFITDLNSEEKTDIGKRLIVLERGLSDIGDDKKMLDVIFAGKVNELKVAEAKISILKESKFTENIFYAMRALSLGGLGALITLLASHMLVPPANGKSKDFMSSNNYWSLLLAHTTMGAVVSTVIFGLFYTKQLTIFHPEKVLSDGVSPEFWRVTMLCIIAGAFAEKLYNAASNRVDVYVEEPNKQKQPDA
ncbi:hypothetical protein WNY97_20640 [Pseudoalteromonas fuliginea]|uniref:hypothetical protein n=1 Tax=Pseudoalteromonas TaxID=53246 RepID=UPI0002AA990D|nr:hypothetical protein [Pseudoalteromonas sp. Bsw20308]ALQ10199.1 hypothetical protein D172_019150 [Pseudoalteromonas sp. Bsw20308]